jgi:hypothetical protein
MLSSELHPDHDSMALIKSVLHGHGDAEEKLKHLRDLLSDNVIVSGWINDPNQDNSPEAMIAALRERVTKFETNQHLREIEGLQGLEEETRMEEETRTH